MQIVSWTTKKSSSVEREDDSAFLVHRLADAGQSEEVSGETVALLPRLAARRALERLPAKKRWMVEQRYGLENQPLATLRHIVEEAGVVYPAHRDINECASQRLAAILTGRRLDEWAP